MKYKYNSPGHQALLMERRWHKRHLRLIIALLVFWIVCYTFTPHTIGRDWRYPVFVVALPIVLGMVVLGIYRRQFLINHYTASKGLVLRCVIVVSYLVQGVFLSFISFGQVAKMSWDYAQYKATQSNQREVQYCPIDNFITRGRRPRIVIKFNEGTEVIHARHGELKDCNDENVSQYLLKVYATKGVWNYYTLNGWEIVRKE